MNRRKSTVYARQLAWLYGALLLVLLPVRIWIDRGLDHDTWLAALAQPLFWFLCASVSLIFGVFGLQIRCGLRLQLRFLLLAGGYFVIVLFLNWTGLPTLLLALVSTVLGILSMRAWHRDVTRILSYRAFRLPGTIPTAGDMGPVYVRVVSSDSGKNPFAQREAAR